MIPAFISSKTRKPTSVSCVRFVTHTNDANGNLTSDGVREYEYDDENQLTRITRTNQWKSEFTYDGAQRRRIRKEYTWSGGAWALADEVRYVYDGQLVIQERSLANAPRVTYTRGLDLAGTRQGAGGIGGLLAREDHTNGTPTLAVALYVGDGKGNVSSLVSTNGLVVAHYLYDPYGNVLAKTGPLAEANLYQFSSKEAHAASGLIYFGRRFYSPALQRWVNQDPIQEADGVNLFAYVRNSPLSSYDAWGLAGAGDHKRPLTFRDYPSSSLYSHPSLFDFVKSYTPLFSSPQAPGSGRGAGGAGSGKSVGTTLWENLPPIIGVPLGGLVDMISGFGRTLGGILTLNGSMITGGLSAAGWGFGGIFGIDESFLPGGWKKTETGNIDAPGIIADIIDSANTNDRPEMHDANRGMHSWHGGSNAGIASKTGAWFVPLAWIGGLLHEIADPGSMSSEYYLGYTSYRFWKVSADSFMDAAFANTAGLITGLLVPPGSETPNNAVRAGWAVGRFIPSPRDQNPGGLLLPGGGP